MKKARVTLGRVDKKILHNYGRMCKGGKFEIVSVASPAEHTIRRDDGYLVGLLQRYLTTNQLVQVVPCAWCRPD